MRRADPDGRRAVGRRLEPNPARDWSTRAGAEALAAEIKRFWTGFGYDVFVWAEVARGGRDAVFTIKSRWSAACRPAHEKWADPHTFPAVHQLGLAFSSTRSRRARRDRG